LARRYRGGGLRARGATYRELCLFTEALKSPQQPARPLSLHTNALLPTLVQVCLVQPRTACPATYRR